jgi:hypothetical protein
VICVGEQKSEEQLSVLNIVQDCYNMKIIKDIISTLFDVRTNDF